MPEGFLENLAETIDRPYNRIMLTGHMHELFDSYAICLRKTVSSLDMFTYDARTDAPLQDIAHQYKVWCANDRLKDELNYDLRYRERSLDTPVVFGNHASESAADAVDLPNPFCIELHATIARIFDMTGAGQFFGKLDTVYLWTECGAPDATWESTEDDRATGQTPQQ